jgi:hypothetical protein
MKHDGTAELLAYWNRLRGKRPAPERSEIEPAEIARQLPDIFILENPEAGDVRFRLAGTRLCAMHGCELKGTRFLTLWSDEDRAGISQIVQLVVGDKSAVVIDHEGTSLSGRRANFETLLLPLGASTDARLIGSTIALDQAYWLGADRIVENSVRAISRIEPRQLEFRVAVNAAASPSFYRQEPSRAASPTSPRQVRHLTVLKGGKA